ncbi:hypothetical protein RFI_36734 [Reticulomyxa filosa]|uniref:Uncharacterized protein n=1 Tax=Reticulomyxa filosa TaxID=46433 RepID=X6LJ10_RETFI|nr:hypothetical protein RFI_36734 [Reticulomyxa filosa]|eukprot:ETO00705.1 hypothetical protein RFI_36734 [Reticulomyxa filosa]
MFLSLECLCVRPLFWIVGFCEKDVEHIIGKLQELQLPQKATELKKLERDLRKFERGLEGLSTDERKYTKLIFIKHSDLLHKTFRRYCKIGGDPHWITASGWVQMLLDCYVSTKSIDNCDKNGFQELFGRVFSSHEKKKKKKKENAKQQQQHERFITTAFGNLGESLSFVYIITLFFYKQLLLLCVCNVCPFALFYLVCFSIALCLVRLEDDDPWTGIWEEDRKNDSDVVERYRLKQIGDSRVVGCIKTAEYCEITGVLGQLDHTIAHLVIQWHQGDQLGQIKKMECKLKLSDHPQQLPKMEVTWTNIEDNTSRASKTMILYKVNELDNEEGLPNTQGLARYEFWDAVKYLIPYVWDAIEKLDERTKRSIIHKNKTVLENLFFVYAKSDNDGNTDRNDYGLGIAEWQLFCTDVFSGNNRFKDGGKPTSSQISAAFYLTLPELKHELDFELFLKALENLAQEMFKKKPKVKYQTPKIDDRLKLLIEEMCVKLQKSGLNEQQMSKLKDRQLSE